MADRPILFSGPMVRGILDGRKNQTRRVVKGEALDWLDDAKFSPKFVADPNNSLCPYGYAGDRLWVREAWRVYNFPCDDAWTYQYKADGKVLSERDLNSGPGFDESKHEKWQMRLAEQSWAECEHSPLVQHICDDSARFLGPERPMRWRPSIHMPRWASRLTLEVERLRIERLQSITVEDVCAEGLDFDGEHEEVFSHWQSLAAAAPPDDLPVSGPLKPEIGTFKTLWDSINGKKHPWESNPWVWVIELGRADS